MEGKVLGVIVGSLVGDDGDDIGKEDGIVYGEAVGAMEQAGKVPKFLVFAELKQDA